MGKNTSDPTNRASSTNKNITSIDSHMQIHMAKNNVQEKDDYSFGNVIKKYRNENDLSQITLAEMMHTSRNTIVNWESNKSRPDIDAIRELCTLLGIPLYELFNIPNNATHTSKENVLLKSYRALSSVSKRFIDKMVQSMLKEETDERDNYLRSSFMILPLESTPVAAGTGCDFNELEPTPVFIKKNEYSEQANAIIRVSGQSMEPLYHNNDLLYVIYTQDYADGDDVICTTSDGAVVKRAKDHKLYSLNDKYPFGERHEDDHVQVLGKVIGIVNRNDIAAETDIEDLEELLSTELRNFNQHNKTNE